MSVMQQEAGELRQKLAAVGYFLAAQESLDLAVFLQERNQPLILEGAPGSGKTSLVYAVAKVYDAPVIRLNCYKSIGVDRVLYGWDRRLQEHRIDTALRANNGEMPNDIASIIYHQSCMKPGVFVRAFASTNPHTCVLINEVDKIPPEEEFEATMLEAIEEHIVTVDESGETIVPVDKPPHIFLTSNAGDKGSSRESLSHPLLRRGMYMNLPEPDRERRFEILCVKAPRLPHTLVRDCALFLESLQAAPLQKPLANSEGIAWVQSLQHFLPLTNLNQEVVTKTLSKLAKSAEDHKRLVTSYPRFFSHVSRESRAWTPRNFKRPISAVA